jgi:hypothetical protein
MAAKIAPEDAIQRQPGWIFPRGRLSESNGQQAAKGGEHANLGMDGLAG